MEAPARRVAMGHPPLPNQPFVNGQALAAIRAVTEVDTPDVSAIIEVFVPCRKFVLETGVFS